MRNWVALLDTPIMPDGKERTIFDERRADRHSTFGKPLFRLLDRGRHECPVALHPGVDLLLTGVAPLHAVGRTEVSFLDNRRYVTALEETAAGAVIVHPDMLARMPEGTMPIVTSNPYEGWARVAACPSSDVLGQTRC